MNTFYHAYVDGFMAQLDTIAEVQAWLNKLRPQVAGQVLKVWKVTDCVVAKNTCIEGIVTK